MVSNFDIRCDAESWGEWNWLRRPVLDVMTQVERWDVRVRLITLVKKNNLIEIRAYPPVRGEPNLIHDIHKIVPKFEKAVWCVECKKETSHDIDMCRVGDVMES